MKKESRTVVESPPIISGYYVKTSEEVENELETSIEHGLSIEEIHQRIERYGPNVIHGSEGVKIHVLLARHTFNFMQGAKSIPHLIIRFFSSQPLFLLSYKNGQMLELFFLSFY